MDMFNNKMKILITGSAGFIGKNLAAELRNRGFSCLFEYDRDSTLDELDGYTRECEFVFHLAGVNRPDKQEDYMIVNCGFTSLLLAALRRHNSKAPVLMTSSTQAMLDNPYGRSKKSGEKQMFQYSFETGVPVYVYRLPNVFGKWCRPDYNSAVTTFCHHIANELPIQVNDQRTVINLVYIDDVIRSFTEKLPITGQSHVLTNSVCCTVVDNNRLQNNNYYETVEPVYRKSLGEIIELLYRFRESRHNLQIPDVGDDFTKKLYATYLSYLPKDKFGYALRMNKDERGSFTELFKTSDCGQVSVNLFKPHVVKGNHWHQTKHEKFLVVSGAGVIRLRKIDTNETLTYYVSGDSLEVIDIPVGYTHNIENTGDTDMVTVMWANEVFDKEQPDTFALEV